MSNSPSIFENIRLKSLGALVANERLALVEELLGLAVVVLAAVLALMLAHHALQIDENLAVLGQELAQRGELHSQRVRALERVHTIGVGASKLLVVVDEHVHFLRHGLALELVQLALTH